MRERWRKSTGICALAGGLFLMASVLAPPNRAQVAPGGTVRIRTVPEPVLFYVDGQGTRDAVALNWPAGSKHILYAAPLDDSTRKGIRYTFNSWTAAGKVLAEGNPVTVTADPSIADIYAQYTVEYALQVSLITCDEPPCVPPGRVYVGGALLQETGTVWAGPGSSVILQAAPNPGFVFAGWNNNNRGQVTQGFINTVTLNEPMTVTPIFQPARQIEFETVPEKLRITADRAPLATPAFLEWGRGSTHSLLVTSPQQDEFGFWWVFKSWDHGGPATQSYTVDATVAPGKIVANFSPAMRVTVGTSPNGLKLKLDGREGQPPYNPIWGVGETHRLQAPLEQTDAQGRVWQFEGWSDGLPAEHAFTVPDTDVGMGVRLLATYRQLGRVTVSSNLPGVTALLDGAECKLPCSVNRPLGTPVRVSAPASFPLGDSSRAEFERWSDGSTGVVTLSAGTEPKTLSATYKTLHKLALSAEPAEGALCRTSPGSPDGFYESSAVVTVAMSPQGGFRFRRWEGDISAPGPLGTVLMNQPRAARAVFDRVPFIPPAGVRNAAADLAADGVAPGSIVAIVGSHLAAGEATGPESPLAQTLGDVVVRVGDRLLPLIHVSPERIVAQLPPDIGEGTTTVAARSGNQEEIRAELRVVRNAPGLFFNMADDRAWAVASHADGSAVTAAAPARADEPITLFGTGFGPTEPQRPWGFAVPAEPLYRLGDPVGLRIAGRPVEPALAAAAPGKVGIDAIAFRVPSGISGSVAVEVETGGRTSNTVYLRVE